jgi:hypothetical protein
MAISPSVPERFLRQLWKHQHIKHLTLSTTDGHPVVVLSPGKPNPDTGPDFLDALVQIGGTMYRGDVELHQSAHEWKGHSHNTDPHYNRVILHVVFYADPRDLPSLTKSRRPIPVLHIAPFLTENLRDTWHRMILDERAERLAHIRCYDGNTSVSTNVIQHWIEKLALERMEFKVRRYEERLRELTEQKTREIMEPTTRYGSIPFGLNPDEIPPPTERFSVRDYAHRDLWNQLLYEGLMEAMGFSKNRDPFLRLARAIHFEKLRNLVDQPARAEVILEAALLGAAGLLPSGVRAGDTEGNRYLRELRAVWKDLRSRDVPRVLTESDWMFFRLRPENFPTIRIAGAARLSALMIRENFVKKIVQLLKQQDIDSRDKFKQFRSMFGVKADGYWRNHFRFGARSSSRIATLVGQSRAADIVVNVVLPISLLYARLFKDKDVRAAAIEVLDRAPKLADNTITRTMHVDLVRQRFSLDSAFLQQGVIQLYKHFCVAERCAECTIGRIVFADGNGP